MSECFKLYMKDVEKISLLSKEEEMELAAKASGGNKEAQNRLVEANLRFVVKMAYKYVGHGLELEELVNAGNIGLIRAAQKFNPSFNTKFITYARFWIREEIQNAIMATGSAFKFPANKYDEMTKDKYKVASLDMPCGKDEGGTLMNFIEDDVNEAPENSITNKAVIEDMLEDMSCLKDKERLVLEYRYGLNFEESMSLTEVGNLLGMTKEGVRLVECRALAKLRTMMCHQDYEDYIAA